MIEVVAGAGETAAVVTGPRVRSNTRLAILPVGFAPPPLDRGSRRAFQCARGFESCLWRQKNGIGTSVECHEFIR